MKEESRFSGTWVDEKHKIDVTIPLIIFEDSGSQILYCPALDVSGYGRTEDEAYVSFKTSLGEFFTYTLNKKTLRQELQRMGWLLKKSKSKPMVLPTMSKLLNDNENFSNIFNNFPFKKINETIPFPA